jgi:hypothetical protein
MNETERLRSTVFLFSSETDVLTQFEKFQMRKYVNVDPRNRLMNNESLLELCPQRPFSNWYNTNFPDLPKIYASSWHGIFSVAREHVHNHDQAFYERLITYLNGSSNPEAGHYFERAWGALFYPYPNSSAVGLYETHLVNTPRVSANVSIVSNKDKQELPVSDPPRLQQATSGCDSVSISFSIIGFLGLSSVLY